MATPDGVQWLLVVVMLGVSGYHLTRLAAGRRRAAVVVDVTHLAMGVVMATMLAGRLAAADAHLLALGFAVPTLWFAVRAVHAYVMSGPRGAVPPLGQTIGCAAMVYMLAGAERPMAGMVMPAGSSVVTALLVTGLAVACVPSLARPSVGAGCQLAMSATAAYMLVAI